MSICESLTSSGKPCRSFKVNGEKFCRVHNKKATSIVLVQNELSTQIIHGVRSNNISLIEHEQQRTNQCQRRNEDGVFCCSEKTSNKFCKKCQNDSEAFLESFNAFHNVFIRAVERFFIPSKFEESLDTIKSHFSRMTAFFQKDLLFFADELMISQEINCFKEILQELTKPNFKSKKMMTFREKICIEKRTETKEFFRSILPTVESFSLEKQIEKGKMERKMNKIKLNMLSEIYLNGQSVFSRDVNKKILSFLN